MVVSRYDRATGRVLYCYSNACVYDGGWDLFSMLARGLILHPESKTVVATPFPKFFNVGERGQPIPDQPFETFEKLDGSLAIIHHFGGRWRAATKGAFASSQALWTEARLDAQDVSALVPGTTYLAEAVYAENRIVIHYAEPALVLLAAYREDGSEFSSDDLQATANALGWRMARRHAYASFSELVAEARALPASYEGFVLRFENGLRLKVKGEEYRRIHSLISGCTPLAMWEALSAGDDMEKIRRDLPEEYWEDFDAIVGILSGRQQDLLDRIAETAGAHAHLSDKELGLSLGTIRADVRPFLFPYRKGGNKMDGKALTSLWRSIRPTGNALNGYVPSFAMGRAMEEAA